MPFAVCTDGTRIYFAIHGSGSKTWIFIHGWGGAAEFWDDFLTNHLPQQDYRVISISLRGHGQSTRPETSPNFADYANDINVVASTCGADVFLLAGFSFGGKVATYFAAKMPEKVEQLTLIAPVGPGLMGFDREAIRKFCNEAHDLKVLDNFFRDWFKQKPEVTIYERLLKGMALTPAKILFDTVDRFAWTDIREQIGTLQIPTKIIAGGHDPVYTVEYQTKQTLPNFTNAQIQTLPCGHFIPIEMPEILADLMFKK